MISAVDSSVLLDVLTDDAEFAERSEAVLRRASREGQLVLCECVVAEILPAFSDTAEFDLFLAEWELRFIPSSRASAVLAGRHFSTYLARAGKPKRIVADFLIGAHAKLHADRLVARDRGYLRDYFAGLTLLDPSR